MAELTMKQGEGKTLVFTVTDENDVAVDISTASCTFTLKRAKTSSNIIVQKGHADINLGSAASGIAKVTLTEDDTDVTAGLYYGELKVWFTASSVEKSDDLFLTIEQAVY